MRRLIPGVLALALLGTPLANAHDDDHVLSRCSLRESPLDPGQGPLNGVMVGYAVTSELGGGEFSCDLRVDGVTVSSTFPTRGERVFHTAGQVVWTADESQVVEYCAHIEWDDGHPPYDRCEQPRTIYIPPQGPPEILNLNELVFEPTDPVTCAILRALAPGVPGVVDVDPATGDTHVLGALIWDCPPYET